MTSRRVNVEFYGQNAEAVNNFADDHDCSYAQATRELVERGRTAPEDNDPPEVVTDGGVDAYDKFLDQIMLAALVGSVVSLILALSSPQFQDLEGAFVTFLFVGLGAVALRIVREKTQGEGADPAA